MLKTCILFILILFFPSAVLSQTWSRQLAEGVTLIQTVERAETVNSMPTKIINILRIDPKVPGVKVAAVIGNGHAYGTNRLKGRDTVSSIAKRLNAVAAVNAGYFWQSADPLSLNVSGGELVSEPISGRAAFGITSDGRMLFDRLGFSGKITLQNGSSFPIRGINRTRGTNELILYTPRFFTTTCTPSTGNEVVIRCGSAPVSPGVPMTATVAEVRSRCGDTPITDGTLVLSGSGIAADFINRSVRPGEVVTIELKLKPERTTGWEKVAEAVSGGPFLVRDGAKYIDAQVEGIKRDVANGRHARTAVGVTRDGKLVIATVGGWRRTGGMTLHQLADLMIGQGCTDAINLDGGGSTTMATSSGVINLPADVNERYIADAIAVFGNPPSEVQTATQVATLPDRGSLASRSGDFSDHATASPVVTTIPDFTIAALQTPVLTGYPYRFILQDLTGQPLDTRLADQAVWSLSGGVGFVDQLGILYAVRAGTGGISARIGSKTAAISVQVYSDGSQIPAPKASTDVITPETQQPN